MIHIFYFLVESLPIHVHSTYLIFRVSIKNFSICKLLFLIFFIPPINHRMYKSFTNEKKIIKRIKKKQLKE